MPTPREVFDHPEQYWGFLTAATDIEFEGQYFDRKEVGQPGTSGKASDSRISDLKKQLQECISAFANANKSGGLLVVGISKTGEVAGIDHLTENQCNNITNINVLLVHQSTEVKIFDGTDSTGNAKKICLIYVPHTTDGICETIGVLRI